MVWKAIRIVDIQDEEKVLLSHQLHWVVNHYVIRKVIFIGISSLGARRISDTYVSLLASLSIDRQYLTDDVILDTASEWLELEEGLSDEKRRWWIPEGVCLLLDMRNDPGVEELL